MILAPPELTILDVASEFELKRRHYFSDGFEGAYNLDNHGLTDGALLQAIVRMEEAGLLVATGADSTDDDQLVTISTQGAKQWELARRPNWRLYIFGGSDTGTTSICGLDPEICWRHLYSLVAFKRLSIDSISLSAEYVRGRLRCWLPETDIYRIDVTAPTIENPSIDLDDWFEKQFWWSGVGDLIREPRFRHG